MKITALSGAHRNSNTEKILSEVVRGCSDWGAEAEIIALRNRKISPCCGWSDCYYKNYCRIKDDMQALYSKLENADGWILATPTYFDNVSSYMKIFMERLNPYCNPPRYKGKKVLLVAVGGASKKSIGKCMKVLKSGFARHLGLKVVGQVAAVADHENEILTNKKALENAYRAGRKFARSLSKPS